PPMRCARTSSATSTGAAVFPNISRWRHSRHAPQAFVNANRQSLAWHTKGGPMSVTSETAEHFDFGRVGSQITGLISRNFVPFVILGALLGGLPQLVVVVVNSMMPAATSPADMAAAYSGSSLLLRFVLIFVLMLPGFVLQAALTRASIDDLSGKP